PGLRLTARRHCRRWLTRRWPGPVGDRMHVAAGPEDKATAEHRHVATPTRRACAPWATGAGLRPPGRAPFSIGVGGAMTPWGVRTYFARFQVASALVPVDVAGLVYFSSSAVIDRITRFCSTPARFGNEPPSTFVVTVLFDSSRCQSWRPVLTGWLCFRQ